MTRISSSTPNILPDAPNDNTNMDQAASLDPLPLAAKVLESNNLKNIYIIILTSMIYSKLLNSYLTASCRL